ncbi:hypothetical protein TRFO_25721 [Tritrichomonas foetus]|uniref:Uncharacterized protein n=1 Tax=Tritrichomonas foetus TaxID=1144522 RepID=A0A1J4K4D5_9EUKA|nr:hypothetical protein TRFO_25721 [Tritrichomonas foetus]|eukprot:OHT06247.1 hypothetical protein TRFO_25721 [Tritrichomonas foetus]
MNQVSSLLISCGGAEQVDSFAVRSDNLATLVTYDGCRSIQSKHCTTISSPFILSAYIDRTKRLVSSHITNFIPKGECSLIADVDCICSGGNYFVGGSNDGTIRFWRISDGELVIEQQLHLGPLSVVYVDTTLWVLFAASTTGRVGGWPIPELFGSAEPEHVWAIHSLKVTDMAVSPNGRVYTVSLDKTARCFDFSLGCEILSINFPTSLTCCALAHNGAILYCGGVDGTIFQISLSQDGGIQQTFVGHTSEISDLVISTDDRSLYSSSLDLSVRRWDTSTGQTINHIQAKSVPFSLHFLPQIDQATATTVDEAASAGRKTKQSRKNAQNRKKGFPKLQRIISGNVDEIVSAPTEDEPILTVSEEMSIAIADICSQQSITPVKTVRQNNTEGGTNAGNDSNSVTNVSNNTAEDEEDSKLTELKKQNGVMFQYILSKQQK